MASPSEIELLRFQKAKNVGFQPQVNNSLQKRLEFIKQEQAKFLPALQTGTPMQPAPGADPNYQPSPASETWRKATSMGADFVPILGDIKSAQEAITGKDLLTGEKYSGWERALAGAGALPLIPNLATLKNISKEAKGGLEMGKKGSLKRDEWYSTGDAIYSQAKKYEQTIPRTESGKIRLYRADKANPNNVRAESSWTPDIEVAEAYTRNPGYGGPNIYRVDVPKGSVFPLSGGREDFEKLGELLGYKGDELYDEVEKWRANFGYTYELIESDPRILSALKEKGYDWVEYPDSFPNNSITYRPLKDFDEKPIDIYEEAHSKMK